jgi:hypothetical protein
MTIYDKFYGKGSTPNFTTVARGDAVASKIVNDSEANNILNLNNFNQTKETRTYQTNYLTRNKYYIISFLPIFKRLDDSWIQLRFN